MDKDNLALLNDFYEYTMASGFSAAGIADRIAYFDIFFRQVPDGGGYVIAAGLEEIINYMKDFHFDESDIQYLRDQNCFSQEWLDSLRDFRFTGDIWAVPEGTVVFPGEPLLTVRARTVEAQILETFLLLCINHQSLIATKSNRIVRAAKGRPVMEFGARRAHGASAAYYGARASYIAGCAGTSCTLTGKDFGIPALGTMAHSWVQIFDDEYTAFKTYCEQYPQNACLLIDTYDVLNSGLPNAMRAFKEVLWPMGVHKCSVRIDSGDLAYLTRRTREILDENGLEECKIVISNSLDEYLINDLISQGGCVDSFGVGERLITAKSDPVLGGVYKLVAIENSDGVIHPRIKISENVVKITTPHFKKIYRLYDKETGKAIADQLCVYDETIDENQPLVIFDQHNPWKRKTVENFTARELMVPIFRGGKLVYKVPSIQEVREYCLSEVDSLWDEVKRFENPHGYYVDLSQKLYDIKTELLYEGSNHKE
ncbi:MAG: nicotinate phosphoribosyltransferase [Oscillospiraceae bacterium]|nr:nicotinate phosphoribosyltransferase [Oscillospiraceae bacterium]